MPWNSQASCLAVANLARLSGGIRRRCKSRQVSRDSVAEICGSVLRDALAELEPATDSRVGLFPENIASLEVVPLRLAGRVSRADFPANSHSVFSVPGSHPITCKLEHCAERRDDRKSGVTDNKNGRHAAPRGVFISAKSRWICCSRSHLSPTAVTKTAREKRRIG